MRALGQVLAAVAAFVVLTAALAITFAAALADTRGGSRGEGVVTWSILLLASVVSGVLIASWVTR